MENKVSMCLCHFQTKFDDKCAISTAKKIGADGIDFSLFMHDVRKEGDIYALGEAAVIEYFTEIKGYADSLGVEIPQTHGRLYGYGITPEEDDIFVRNSELDCLATAILGAKYCVVHSPSIAWVADGVNKTGEEMLAIHSQMMSELVPFAKKHNLKIAIETHGDSRKLGKMEFFGYVDNLIEATDRTRKELDALDNICVCVDTGHTNMTVKHGNPDVGEVIRRLGDRVEVLHLHDNDGGLDQHKIPMTGAIDWPDVMCALREIGYGGWYNLENDVTHFGEGFETEEAKFSVKVLRHMIKTL